MKFQGYGSAMAVTAWAMAGVLTAGAASAETPPLTRDELGRCALQVQELRRESDRLNKDNARLDARRKAINQRSAELRNEAAALDPNDMERNLALGVRRKAHNQDTLVFNADIGKIRSDINAINVVKQDYDRNCSNRPYKRKDLAALPEAAQQAMRAGLTDVVVPYIDSVTPLE